MRAEDLMIGDWYAFRGHPYKCTASDIASIAECEEIGAPTDISEIPLTVKILEKNGWRSIMNGTGEFYLKKPLVDAAIMTKTIAGFQMNHGPFNGLSIHYVHELQHALRLCGITKEIQI